LGRKPPGMRISLSHIRLTLEGCPDKRGMKQYILGYVDVMNARDGNLDL